MTERSQPKIVSLGSINMDRVVRCTRLPLPGETVTSHDSEEVCGGKGANQAVAAARAGGDVSMIGRVGDDDLGRTMLTNLQDFGVDTDCVGVTPGTQSGLAIVAVEQSGQNSILVIPAANGSVSSEDVTASEPLIAEADVILLQMEIPIPAILTAIDIARRNTTRIVFDPAPVPKSHIHQLIQVDLICPNEHEASELTGRTVDDIQDAERAAHALLQQGAKDVIITLGEKGSAMLSQGKFHHIPAYKIDAIDTTAAGDAFTGALAVRWAETDDLLDAVNFASAAGAIAASSPGAQPSLGDRAQIEALMRTR